MRAGGNFLQISAADSAGVHAHEQFARANLGDGNSLQTNVVHAAIYGRQHGGGNRLRLFFDQGLSSYSHIESVNSGLQSLDASPSPNRPNLRGPGCIAAAIRRAL